MLAAKLLLLISGSEINIRTRDLIRNHPELILWNPDMLSTSVTKPG